MKCNHLARWHAANVFEVKWNCSQNRLFVNCCIARTLPSMFQIFFRYLNGKIYGYLFIFARMSDLYIVIITVYVKKVSLCPSLRKNNTPKLQPGFTWFFCLDVPWRKLGYKWLVNGLLHLPRNGVYWGYNPFTNHLLSSWDIQMGSNKKRRKNDPFRSELFFSSKGKCGASNVSSATQRSVEWETSFASWIEIGLYLPETNIGPRC